MLRSHYVTVLWSHAHTPDPDQGLSPTDNGQNATTGNANDSDSDDTIVLGQSEENTMERDDFDEFDLSNLCDDEPWTEEDSDSDGEEM